MLDVLTNDADTEGVVHRLVEKVSVELDDVWVVLGFEKLNCFLLQPKMSEL
jgi:hypothetical protein